MRPKFQKQSALKLAGRIIPRAKRCGTMTLAENKRSEVMMPKFQKQRVLKLAGRIIPGASRRGI